MKRLLFSVTAKDFDTQTFTVGGHGGAGKDTSNNGVRLVHRASGAVGEGREHRQLSLNRRAAFMKLVQTPVFKRWHNEETRRRLGLKTIEDKVNEMMQPDNLKIEYEVARGVFEQVK